MMFRSDTDLRDDLLTCVRGIRGSRSEPNDLYFRRRLLKLRRLALRWQQVLGSSVHKTKKAHCGLARPDLKTVRSTIPFSEGSLCA
jgi:hypothetical protein